MVGGWVGDGVGEEVEEGEREGVEGGVSSRELAVLRTTRSTAMVASS